MADRKHSKSRGDESKTSGARLDAQLLKERLYRVHGKAFSNPATATAATGAGTGTGARAQPPMFNAGFTMPQQRAAAAPASPIKSAVASAAMLDVKGMSRVGGAAGAGLVADKRAKRARELEKDAAENLARASEVSVPKTLQPLLGASMPLRNVKLLDDAAASAVPIPIGRYSGDADMKAAAAAANAAADPYRSASLMPPGNAYASPSRVGSGPGAAADSSALLSAANSNNAALSKSRLPTTPMARRALIALSHKHSSASAAATNSGAVPTDSATAAAVLSAYQMTGAAADAKSAPASTTGAARGAAAKKAALLESEKTAAGWSWDKPRRGDSADPKKRKATDGATAGATDDAASGLVAAPSHATAAAGGRPINVKQLEYEMYLLSPFSFIDKVIEQPYTEEFVYLVPRGPYDLQIVKHDRIDPTNYYTMSRAGVTHFYQTETDFTSLDQWEREYFLYTKMMGIKFFEQFRKWKAFYFWKKYVRRTRLNKCIAFLQNNLYILNPVLQKSILQLRAHCYKASQWTLFKIDPRQHTLTLTAFCSAQQQQKLQVMKWREQLTKDVRDIVKKACDTDKQAFLVNNKFRRAGTGAGMGTTTGGAGSAPGTADMKSTADMKLARSRLLDTKMSSLRGAGGSAMIDDYDGANGGAGGDGDDYNSNNNKVSHAEKAAIRSKSRQLTKFIRLADYFVIDTLITLCTDRTSDVLKFVRREPGAGRPDGWRKVEKETPERSARWQRLAQKALATAPAPIVIPAASEDEKHPIRGGTADGKTMSIARSFGVQKEDRNVEKPLFSVELQLEHDQITFTPQLKVFQETLKEFIIHAVKKVMSYDRLIADPEPAFQIYTNVAQDDGDDDQSAELKLDAYVLEDDSFLETIEGIKEGLALAFQQAAIYVRDFERYLTVYLDNQATDIQKLREATILKLQERLKTFHQQNRDFERMKTIADIGIIQVDSTKLKEHFLPSPKRCISELERLLPELFRDCVKSLSDEIQYHKDNLFRSPNTVPEFAQILTLLAAAQDNLPVYAERHLFVTQLHDLMTVEHSIKVGEDDKQKFDELEKLRANFGMLVQKTDQDVPANTERFARELTDHIPQLEAKVTALAVELKDEIIADPKSDAKEVIDYLEKRADKILQLEEQVDKYREYQEKFGMDKTQFAELKSVKEDLELKLRLWQALKAWDELQVGWHLTPFARIDTVDIGTKVADYMRTCNKSKKALPEVVKVLRDNISTIQDTLPVVTDLRSPHLLARHWDDITVILQHDLKADENVTLGTLISRNAMKHQAAIKAIAIKASNEAILQAALNKVDAVWEDMKFPVILHNKSSKEAGGAGAANKDQYVLGNLDDVITALDDSNVTINTVLGSRFVDALKKEVTEWAAKLKLFEDTLNEWTTCQRKWLYLETIFSEKDMVKQLPEEAQLFMKVDVQWKDIMRRTAEAPNAMKACINGPGATNTTLNMLAAFKSFNRDLEEVRKQMEKFLETRRAMFPRFYFMSDEELIYILSKSKTAAAIQKALEKCFDNIFALEFKQENRDVRAMFSAEGEKVVFGLPTKTHRAIESWLGDLEKNMWGSLKAAMRTGYQQNTQQDTKLNITRADFIKDSYAQVVMTIAQILWCIGTQRALTSEKPREALTRWYEIQVKQLAELTALVRGSLRDADRKKIVALITTDVHARDVIGTLMKDGVTSVSHFSWQQQLRFYWDKDSSNVHVRQANAEFLYGYEYIGIASRLVITPLTDRCWMTVTGALHLRFGASPAGPAGTGKTESVKDLAKALGFFCIVFNCSDTIQYQGMARHFSGLAQTGAWTCLDEFNRIDIEVLSVVAQQLLSIRQALLQSLPRFNFEQQEILLKSTFGVMITMNPDYAGRTELPDNLKVLFRPVAMMIPDYAMIAEIMLYAEGFDYASDLSKKMVKLYKLSSEQLSQQDHYDFGMRAVKSVLVMAGALKREDPTLSEDKVLIRAMRDSNLPKFLSQDLPLFHAIVSDLFPTVKVPDRNNGELEVAIQNVITTSGLQLVPSFVTKVVQLHDTFNVRFGVMLVGPTGAGKSTCYNVLARAMDLLRQNDSKNPAFQLVHINIINPKCITREELYGEVNELTQVWSDGLASSILRNAMLDKSNDRHWVVFDGPIDAMWIENMNSVLDDNMTLCLVNGERIKLKKELRMLFEVQDLAAASPATVSRCGMVYMAPGDLGWMPYVQSWLPRFCKKMDVKLQHYLLDLFKVKVTAGLNFIREHTKGKEPIPTVDISLVTGLCAIFSSLFTEANGVSYDDTFEVQKQTLETVFAFAFAWGIGGALDTVSQQQFAKYMSELFLFVRVPGSLFDYFVDVKDGGSFRQWESRVPNWVYDAKQPYFQILVPTIDTVRYGSLLETLLDVDKPVFFTGYTGVGKSVVAMEMFHRLSRGPSNPKPDPAAAGAVVAASAAAGAAAAASGLDIKQPLDSKQPIPIASAGGAVAGVVTSVNDPLLRKETTYLPMTLTFSAQTDAKKTQLTIESKLFRLSARLLGPPTPDKKVVIFVDDVNMPALEDFDGSAQAQPPVELLRQFLDYKMFYDRKTFTEKKIDKTTLMCCAAPPGGGRNELTPRFVRHFNMLSLPNPPDTIMRKIFGSILSGFFSGTDFKQAQLPKLSDMIVAATIELYNNLSTELPPIPEKAHYIFNLRDMSKVFQGILMIKPAAVPNHDTLVRLWIHELMRCFHDRLVSVEDKRWFTEKIVQLLVKHFGLPWAHDDLFERRMIMFGDWFRTDATEPNYEENLTPVKTADVLDEYLEDYNKLHPTKMNLVFFDDAIVHISRIARILRQPRGNAMLVGVGGSGKQSLTRLACFICDYAWMPIELTRGYTYADFQEHTKRCFITAGVEGKKVVFPVVDNQIIDERFLEDINNILNSGEVPNLFPPDELHKVIEDLTPKVREQKLAADTSTATVLAVFNQRVRDHLHVVLCMSPVGDSFRTRCRKFPSLINCTTIDWYSKWSPQALLSVATRVLSTVPDTTPELVRALSEACVDIHESMDEKCELFYSVLRRRVYTTPKSYLDMIACYVSMLTERRNELRAQQNRFLTGISKLGDTKTVVAELKEMLVKLQPTLIDKRRQTDVMIQQLDVDTRAADKVRLVVERETKLVNQQTDAQRELQVEAAADLEKTRPLLESAEKAVASLDRTQLAELRMMQKPPPLVSLALESVCLFFGEAPTFDNAKKIASNPSFVTQLKNIIAQKDKIDPKVITKLKKFLQNDDFKEENITPVFRPAGALCAWVHAMYRYSEVWKVVAPKQQRLIDMTELLKKQQIELKKKEDELRAVETNVNDLKRKCDEAMADKNRLEKKMADTELKLIRAETLTGALGNEHIRWRADADKKANDLKFVLGDVFVAAACVSYYGGFTGDYRAALVAQWVELTRDKKIPVTEDWTLQAVLATPRDIQQWTSVNHLPTDDVSIDSAIIVKHAPRWPLMIDPQGQAKKWIKAEYRMAKDEIVEDVKNPNLICVRQSDENLMKYLDRAVKNGKVVLMEDIGEEVDGALDPILLKQMYTPPGGGGLVLKLLGEQESPYDQNFRFFMTTNLSNPHYLPEVCIKVTLLNFTVTRRGLEDQLLSDVVKLERAEIEAQRQKYIISIANEQKTLFDIETKMLHLLSTSSGKVLDDETLSGTLADSKERYNSITQRVKSAQEITASLNLTRDQYRIVAGRGSILYFVIADLAMIDPMYQYSLPYFVNLFKVCIKKSKVASDLKERLENILQTTTDTIFSNVSRGLFEQHKLMFSFLICTQILRLERKEISDVEWNLLLRAARPSAAAAAAAASSAAAAAAASMGGGADRKAPAVVADPNPNPNKNLFTEEGWNLVVALDTSLSAFKDFARDIREHLPAWKSYIESDAIEKKKPPGAWDDKMSSFQHLLLLKAFRPEKLMLAIHAFVSAKMGPLYVDTHASKLEEVYRDSDFKTPIIFVLSTGADPANLLFNFATDRGMSDRLHVISLGKGQGDNATRFILQAKERGDWVLLQNCHLAKSWMSELERHVERLSDEIGITKAEREEAVDAAADEKGSGSAASALAGTVDKDFRLWLTSMPSESFPVSVLQVGIKLTNEPPKGLKSNLIRSYTTVIKPNEFEKCTKPKPWRKLVFGLCFFHAVIQERKKFGSLGWNKSYEFNDSDLEAAMQVLRNFLEGHEDIPWDALRYVCGQINYGGRVTDDWDRRCLSSILSKFYTPEIVQNDAYRFLNIPAYYAPKDGDLKSYVRYIELLPAMADPQIFGMHENANITFQRAESENILRTLLSIQPREIVSAGGRPTKEIVRDVAREIEDRLPALMDRKRAETYIVPQADRGGWIDSLGTVLVQEIERFNRLLSRMKKSLEELRLANDGKLAMSVELDSMYTSLLNNEVPDLWSKVAYPSLKPLASWVKDLHQRITFMNNWLLNGPPKCFWLSGFFFTQGFMTGVLQSHARKVKTPIDTLAFRFNVLDVRDPKEVVRAPEDGVYVYGLFMDGARWDAKTHTIADSRLGEVYSPVPMIHFIPTENYVPSPKEYACPVYKTPNRAGVLSTTGQSTNFVLAVSLPSLEKPEHWVLRGAALLLSLSTPGPQRAGGRMADKFNSYAGTKVDSRNASPSTGGGRVSRANSFNSMSGSSGLGGAAGVAAGAAAATAASSSAGATGAGSTAAGGAVPLASAVPGTGVAAAPAVLKSSASSKVIKAGLLSKKAEVMKSWRTRFFVLEDQRLVYFIAKDDEKPRAIAIVKGCTVTDPQPIEGGALYEFVATFPNSKGAVYNLASDNRAEADAWVKAIRTVATPEFTRGRIQEIEDKERQVSRAAHQQRLPAPAFELLQQSAITPAPNLQSQAQATGWYMAEAGPAYRSWLHNGEEAPKVAAPAPAAGDAKAAAAAAADAPATPVVQSTSDSGIAKFFEKCTILWGTTAAAIFVVFKVLGWLSTWFYAVSSILLVAGWLGSFYWGIKKNLTVWKLAEPDAEMWTARMAIYAVLALALLPGDIFVPLAVLIVSFNALPFRDPASASGVIVFGGLLRRRTTILLDHPPKLILRLLVNSMFRREWDVGLSKANVLESFRGRERQILTLEYQTWNRYVLPDVAVTIDQNWYNAGGGTYVVTETSKESGEGNGQLMPEYRGGVVVQPWRESGASVTFVQNWDFTSIGLLGFLAARTMPSRAAELAYSLHSALASLAHRSVELAVRPEGAVVHPDPSLAAAADAQANEAETTRLKFVKFVDEAFETLQRLADEKEGWEHVAVEEGITITKKPSPCSEMPIVRGTGIVNAPPLVCISILIDYKRKKEWDEMFKLGVLIQRIDQQTIILHQMFEKVPFVSARDFLTTSSWRLNPDGSFFAGGKSLTHEACPPSKSYIRAEVFGGGFVGRPVPGKPNQTQLTYIAWSDLKGSLPASLTKAISVKQPLIVAKLNAKLAPLAPDYKGYDTAALLAILKDVEKEKAARAAGGTPAPSGAPASASAGTARGEGEPLRTLGEGDEKLDTKDSGAGNAPPSPVSQAGSAGAASSMPASSLSDTVVTAAGVAAAAAGGMDFLRNELNLPPAVDYKASSYEANWPGREWMERYPPSNFSNIVRTAFEDLFDNCDPAKEKEWTFVKRKKDVDIFRRDLPGRDVPKVKGVGIVDYSVAAVMTLLWDIQRKKEYDPGFKTGRELQLVDEQTAVVYQEFEGQLFVTSRDFVNISSLARFRDGSYAIAARSVEHDAVPRDKNHIRGEIYTGGFIVRPVPGAENKSHITFMAHVDLKGSLPSSIINFVSNDQPLTIDGIRTALKAAKARNDVVFPPPLKYRLPFGERRVAIYGGGENEKTGGGRPNPLERQGTVGPAAMNEDLKELMQPANETGNTTATGTAAAAPNPYLELAESTMQSLIREDSIKDGWQFSHEEKDIAVWTKRVGATAVCVKGVGVINASPMDVMQTVSDVAKRKWFDESIGESRIVERIDDCTQVVHLSYSAAGVQAGGSTAAAGTSPSTASSMSAAAAGAFGLCRTGARDFVAINYWRRLPNGTCILVGKSVEHAAAPPSPSPALIRADLLTAGWVIKPSIKDANRSLVTYVLHVDLKGSVTSAMTNAIIKRQPLCIDQLRALFDSAGGGK